MVVLLNFRKFLSSLAQRTTWLSWLANRELWIFAPIYFSMSMVSFNLKERLTPGWTNGLLADNHQKLLAFVFTNNEQSRLFQYLIPQVISQILGVDIENAYLIQRVLFVTLAFLAFHFYLRKWFSSGASLGGVATLAALMPLTFMDDLQESSPLLMLTFVLALWAIRDRKDIAFLISMGVGCLNNETMLVLSAVYFFYNFNWESLWHFSINQIGEWFGLVWRTVLLVLPGFLFQVILRIITRDNDHLGDPINWNYNWDGIWAGLQMPLILWYKNTFLFFILIFLFLWIYALIGYKKSDRFLQRALWMVPFFILSHLITGKIEEARQMIPLGYIAIPMAMKAILPPEDQSGGRTELAE